MANENDSHIALGMIAAQDDPGRLLKYCERWLHEMEDDANYWKAVVIGWVKHGRVETQERWRRLMLSPRPHRERGMTTKNRRLWAKLPQAVVGYRAAHPGEDLRRAISWSLRPERIREIYPDREVVKSIFNKSAVFWYTDRRNEGELIIPLIGLGRHTE